MRGSQRKKKSYKNRYHHLSFSGKRLMIFQNEGIVVGPRVFSHGTGNYSCGVAPYLDVDGVFVLPAVEQTHFQIQ